MTDASIRRGVFVDTSGWYALLVQRDTSHRAAVRHFNALAAARRPLVVTNYIVAETFTLLRVRRGADAALGFLTRIRATPTVRKVRVEQDWEEAAEQLLTRYREHELSYVDVTSFVAMQHLGVAEVLTFDADFNLAGFTILGRDRQLR